MDSKDKQQPQPDQSSNQDRSISREGFFAVAGSVAGAVTLSTVTNQLSPRSGGPEDPEGSKHKWGMLIDINKCIGCNYCTYACQAINDLPEDMLYNEVTLEETQKGTEYYLSRPCLHCENPPCVHVCPVEATYLRDDGIVTMDYDKCIGCRYCEIACPYDARVFNWDKNTEDNPYVPAFGQPEVERRARGVMEKCTFCEHRIDAALARDLVPGVDDAATPACVVACPTGARVFGDLNQEDSPINIYLRQCENPLTLRDDLSTSPKVFYIPPRPESSAEEEA